MITVSHWNLHCDALKADGCAADISHVAAPAHVEAVADAVAVAGRAVQAALPAQRRREAATLERRFCRRGTVVLSGVGGGLRGAPQGIQRHAAAPRAAALPERASEGLPCSGTQGYACYNSTLPNTTT